MPIVRPSSTELETFRTISTIDDVASFLNTSRKRLFYHLYSRSRPPYRVFLLAKKSGGNRKISSPPKVIHAFQRKILQCLQAMVNPREPVHGFVPSRGVITNAKCHLQRALILNIDIKDFFDSIHFGRVRGVFLNPPFSFPTNVASILASICCVEGVVPQGSPTSPILSNLICRRLDRDLERLARNHKCRYTRYADDITFSTELGMFDHTMVESVPSAGTPSVILGSKLLQIFQKHDFQINEEKVRLKSANQRQEVTGIIVNTKVNVPRRFIRNLRAILYDCEKNGIEAADARFRNGLDKKQRYGKSPPLIEHIRGKLDYMRMVRGGADPLYVSLALRAQQLFRPFKYGVPIWGQAAIEQQILERTIWIVLAIDKNGHEVEQGTAFSLDKVGVVSSCHVFRNPTPSGYSVDHFEIFRASSPTKKYRVTKVKQHRDVDIAIVQSEMEHLASLRPSLHKVQAGDSIVVVGYPQWHSIADKLFYFECSATQARTISGVDYVTTTATIRTGNSGGPILDNEGRVLGIAVYDSSGHIAPNGGVSIKHVEDVQRERIQDL